MGVTVARLASALPSRQPSGTNSVPGCFYINIHTTTNGNGEIDRFLVHINTHVQLARLLTHGLPPVFRLTPSRLNVWLCVVRHAIHDTEEAGRLLLTGSHYV